MTEFVGRREDPTLMRCEVCNWEGELANCSHSYMGYPIPESEEPDWDVEPADFCPNCGSDCLEDMGDFPKQEIPRGK